jgi:predicted ATPase/DNA-binding CsgD family transcriptional regulator
VVEGRRRHNLPTHLTSFVGRRREVAEVAARLGEHRLVTLTGAGGVGKTRLSFEVAAEIESGYPDGVWTVELAPVTDPARVPIEVAARLGIELRGNQSPVAVLQEQLANRQLLLVLDNCEHLVAACADLAEVLLRACPGLCVMATSRERLGVPGEAVYVVPPLAAPGVWDTADPTEITRYDAVQLFVERAQLVRADFTLLDDNATAVTTICRALDGIPLAIELAAARVRALSVAEIASRLAASPFRMLTSDRGAPRRQQTLAATLDWSYALLNDPERKLLRCLSVFVGGFELDAAEAICGGETVVDQLTNLVDKSLVIVERRYRLLEPIRQYAAAKLAEVAEADAVRARHRDWYLDFAERAVDGMIASDQLAWHARLDDEHDNLRAALEYCRVEPAPESELRLVGSLAAFWIRHTKYAAEGRARLDDVLARTEHVSSLAGRRARILALDWRGYFLRGSRGRWISPTEEHTDTAHAERAVALARELGDRGLLATALRHLATNDYTTYGLGSSPSASTRAHVAARAQAQAWLEEAVDCARGAGIAREVGYSLAHLAGLAHARGDVVQAERLCSESLAVLRQAGDRDALHFGLAISARLALRRGDRERARRELEECAALRRELSWPPLLGDATALGTLDIERGDFANAMARFREIIECTIDPGLLVFALLGVARVAAAWGDAPAAVRLSGAAIGHPVFRQHTAVPEAVDAIDAVNAFRVTLGDEGFAAAWAEGQQMSLDDALASAWALKPPSTSSTQSTGLTPREQEVARLVAEGMTNREIATALVIAEPTAERHVANILSKLGFHTRTQIATWHERQMNVSRVESSRAVS